MDSREGLVKAQTVVRKQLLRNGYSFFPCRGKAGQRYGWPEIEPTEALIDQWSRELAGVSTALHVGKGGLVMVDWDIDHPVMTALVEAMPFDLWTLFAMAPVRTSGKQTEAWLVRLAPGPLPHGITLPYMLRTMGFHPPGARPDDDPHRLEIFLRHPKVCVAYGAHTVAKDNRVERSYSWVNGRGPHNVPLADLPEVSFTDLARLVRWVNEQLPYRGWVADTRGVHGLVESKEVFDLTPQTVFSTVEGVMTFAELDARVSEGPIKLSASFKDGRDSEARNHRRCVASRRHDGVLQVFDFADYCAHMPKEAERPAAPVLRSAAKLAELAERDRAGRFDGVRDGEIEPDGSEPESLLDLRTAELLRDYAFCPEFGATPVINLATKPPSAMSMPNTRMAEAPFEVVTIGPRGGKDVKSPVDLWLAHPDRITVRGLRANPATTDRVFEDADGRWVNTWMGFPEDVPVEPDYAAQVMDGWRSFLAHLLPNARERAWFENWLAVRAQLPTSPACAVLMTTPQHGTGRGTLFDLLQHVFGKGVCNNVTAQQLIGENGQAAYNDWMDGSLLVMCEELSAGGDRGVHMRWRRQAAYERLKVLADPRPRWTMIIRKGLPNRQSPVWCSLLMATNHDDALPFTDADRRFAILTNGRVKLADAPEVQEGIALMRGTTGAYRDDAMTVLRQHILSLPADPTQTAEAPRWTEGRKDMLEANLDVVDVWLRGFLDEAAARGRAYLTFKEVEASLRVALAADGVTSDVWRSGLPERFAPETGWARSPRVVGLIGDDGKRKQVRVYYRMDGPGVAALFAVNERDRLSVIQACD